MNPFRRAPSKRPEGTSPPTEPLPLALEAALGPDDETDGIVQAIDALVDSDPEGTDIFDDSDNDDEDGQNAASSINSSRQSSQAHPSESPGGGGFKDVLNLGQPLLSSVPKLVMPQRGESDDRSADDDDEDDDEEDDHSALDNDQSTASEDGANVSDDSASAEDYSDDEEEGEEGYKPGGYHRVAISETYNQR